MYLLENNFETATEAGLQELKNYFGGFDYFSSGHTYSSAYMWGPQYDMSWQVIDGLLWTISSYLDEFNSEKYYTTMPLTMDGEFPLDKVRSSLNTIVDILKEHGQAPVLYQVPMYTVKYIKEAWKGYSDIKGDLDSDDYIYERKELVDLTGKKLHKKKNHLNYFIKHFDYEVMELKEEDVEEAIDFVRKCNHEKAKVETPYELEILKRETSAVERALRPGIVKPDYITRVIKIEGNIEALAIGALESKFTAIEHIEKANADYRGLFQAINNEFCKALPEDIVYVNREEDLGIPNLKKAKESYMPYSMYKKCTIVLK